MGYLRPAIITTILLLIAVLILMVFTFDSEKELRESLRLYLSENYEESQAKLSRLQSSLSPMHYYLYKGYLERAQNNREQSTKDFEQAEASAADHADFVLLHEILINEAYNAYLSGDKDLLDAIVKKASKYGGPDEPWVLLFRGIVDYNKERYQEALDLWKQAPSKPPLSPWMKQDFENTFNPSWMALKMARAYIEVQKYAAAREILERITTKLSGEDLHKALFLMGYNYAKEASQKTPADAIALYQLALPYLNKASFAQDNLYQKERQELILQAQAQVEMLLQENNYADLPFYLTIFDSWQADGEIARIKQQLLFQFNRAIALNSLEDSKEIYGILRLIIPEGPERQQLELSLEEESIKITLENIEQEVRTGAPFSEKEAGPDSQAEKEEGIDPLIELIAIQGLIKKALNDHNINPEFRVDRSTDLQKAATRLRSFLRKEQNIAESYILLGQTLYLLGDMSEAAKAYEKAAYLDPRNPLLYQYMALLYEDANQPLDAIQLLLQALKFAPKNPDIWGQLADLYMQTGNELDAIPSYKEALHIDPEKYHLLLALARLQVHLEMPEDAKKNLEEYLKYEPNDKEGLRLLLLTLYNPLLDVSVAESIAVEKERTEIYNRLWKISPEDAERIRKNYRPPPTITNPPPKPEPNLPLTPLS